MKVAWVLVAASLIGCRSHHSSSAGVAGSGDAGTGAGTGGVAGGPPGGRGGAGGAFRGPLDAAPDAPPDLPADAPPDVAPDRVARDTASNDPAPSTFDTALPDGPAPPPDALAPEGPLPADGPLPPDGPPPLTPEFHLTLPLSSSTVTTHNPTVGWTDPGGTDYFIIDVCRDVLCNEVFDRNYSGLTTYTVMSTLPEGVMYWRVKAMFPGGGQISTATAELFVGAQTPHDTSMLAVPDFNLDGVPDVALAAEGGDVTVRYFRAVSGGPTPLGAPLTLPGPARALAYGIDLNADGNGDLLVGRPDGVDVYYGSSTTLIKILTLTGGPGFGATVAGVGDVNGDGFGDVVIGTQPSGGAGTASLFLSSRMGLGKPSGPALAAARAAAAADVNADGYADVVACSSAPAKAYFYRGAAGGLVLAATLEDPRGLAAGTFGNACQGVGDVNGDGFGDVVVTGSGTDLVAFLYLGGEKGLSAPTTLTLGPAAGHTADELQVASAGDVNRDGYTDVLVTGAGAVRLFLGSPTGLAAPPATTIAGDYRLAAGLGDLDGDRGSDVLVAPRACGEPVKIFGGTSLGLTTSPIYTFPATGAPLCPGPLLGR